MPIQDILESVAQSNVRTDLPPLEVGDAVNVHTRIVEGEKERIQVFSGVLVSRKGRGVNEMITVRRVADEVGIERTWPLNTPLIAKIEVVRHGHARRAKLYYLRDRVGKARRLRDRKRKLHHYKS